MQDLATFQPEVVDALEMPLGNYTLYSPPPPSGGAILSFILNVLRGKRFSGHCPVLLCWDPEPSAQLWLWASQLLTIRLKYLTQCTSKKGRLRVLASSWAFP